MCVIGNPPYSGESVNKGDWIMRLMDAYKKEPGGKEKLNERNPKWINDDYVKFIRFSEYLIERNGDGVLGFITNHGYLDNPTFRGMRWHLLNTFDKFYVLDLHGNAKKKEVKPDGKPDKNVFDIQQGVSIIIGVKKRQGTGKKPLAEVFHADLWSERAEKYEALRATGLTGGLWQRLEHRAPQYPLTRRNYGLEAAYMRGFGVQEFMPVNSVGIVTARDALTIDVDKQTLWDRVRDFAALAPEVAREKYKLGKDVQDWSVAAAQADVKKHFSEDLIVPIYYRPFDKRWTYFTGTSRGFQCRPREEVMRHFNAVENYGLGVCRQSGVNQWAHVSICDALVDDSYISNRSKERGYVAPLYVYPAEQDLDQNRRVNFDPDLYKRLQRIAVHPDRGEPDELAVFDFIYGVLHCPAYRATYVEFLKINFPRIPWPANPAEFWDVSDKGGRLRRLHLMEPQVIGATPFPFKGEGDAVVDKPRFEGGKVWINETKYFDDAPEVPWDFYIGGYQPAQKWLKDRNRALSFEDVKHYQRILKILSETDRIMHTITMTLEAGEA